ncbi:MAG: hypothetical protein FVQ80_06800 [Planctomycetes bacterium]|nr:hypothetical protein [Planctomycetota bacterium]
MNEVRRSKQAIEDEEPEQKPSVEIYERVIYEVKAINLKLASQGLSTLLQSQDKIVKIHQTKGTTFEATVLLFRLRDF